MDNKVSFENDYYVIDKNFRLVAFNKTLADRFKDIKVGDLCYKATMNRESPCLHCPIAGNTTCESPIFFNPNYNDWAEAVFSKIDEGMYGVICRRTGNGNPAVDLSASQIALENSGKAINDAIVTRLNEQFQIIKGLNNIFFSICHIDLQTRKYRLITTLDSIEKTARQSTDADAAIKRTIDEFVLPESREAMRDFSNLDTLGARLRNNSILTLDYKGVLFGWARAIIVPIERDGNGNVTNIVYCLRNINGEKEKEICQQAALEERMAIIKGLAEEYFSVMIVDLESDSARIYRESGDYGRKIGEFFARYSTWSEGVKAYSEKYVADEDRAEFYRLLSLRGLRSAMADFGANYVMLNDTGVSHIQFKVSFETDKAGKRFAVIGTKSVDEEFHNQLILRNAQREVARSYGIIEGLSCEYHVVWYIRASDRTMHLYRFTANTRLSDSLRAKINSVDYDECMNRYIDLYVDANDRERVREACIFENLANNIGENGIYTVNLLHHGEDKADAYRQMVFTKTKDEFNNVNYVLAIRDIDAMVREEQQKQKALRDALSAAEHANRAKTTFLNNMSHDIRTPMNAILGFASLAVTHIDNTGQLQDYLKKIQVSGNHLLNLINDVLDMSRIESGKVKIEEKENNLPDIFHDLRTLVQSDINAKQLDFYIDTVDVVNENVICDKLRLSQVLMNILSNAIKFTKHGGMISLRLIQVPCMRNGYARYEFSVKDTGIGISSEFISHVFEPFEREFTSTVSGIQGTGLGMAITKNIVELMGGTIAVESEVNKGTEFIVELEFKICGQPAKPDALPELRGMKVLVVDDDVNSCMSVCKMLSSIEMRSEWTSHGKEALIRAQFAIEQNEEFDAYIIDLLMLDLNGVELARQLRRVVGSEKPIIILTAYDWADIEQEALAAGVTAFCSKPVFLSELQRALVCPTIHDNSNIAEPHEIEEFKGKRILLVEDNELNQEIAVGILTETGLSVDVANDGSVALEKMTDFYDGKYDLVLMDIQMPFMDGYETTKRIRRLADEQAANIPIIAMTANAFSEDEENAYSCGMNGFVTKPIEIPKLLKVISDVFTAKN